MGQLRTTEDNGQLGRTNQISELIQNSFKHMIARRNRTRIDDTYRAGHIDAGLVEDGRASDLGIVGARCGGGGCLQEKTSSSPFSLSQIPSQLFPQHANYRNNE